MYEAQPRSSRPEYDNQGISAVNAQGVGNKTPEVQMAIQTLEQVTNRIDVELKGLIERIVPVMATTVANGATDKMRTFSAPLAASIGMNVERLHEVLRLITLAHSALEI